MDLITKYKKALEQLKETKEFLVQLDPVDYELRAYIHQIDQKINKTEQSLHTFQLNTPGHRCGLCDRPYDEDEAKAVGNVKVCPYCREIIKKFRSSGEMEKKYELSQGTIKRDCLSKDGNPPKLQSYMDCGLVYKTGAGYIVHEIVMTQYYANENEYKRRKSRTNSIKSE